MRRAVASPSMHACLFGNMRRHSSLDGRSVKVGA
jgi:hypothetical protein